MEPYTKPNGIIVVENGELLYIPRGVLSDIRINRARKDSSREYTFTDAGGKRINGRITGRVGERVEQRERIPYVWELKIQMAEGHIRI